jgi:hypothetical protein
MTPTISLENFGRAPGHLCDTNHVMVGWCEGLRQLVTRLTRHLSFTHVLQAFQLIFQYKT